MSKQRHCNVTRICRERAQSSSTLNQACKQGDLAHTCKHPSFCSWRYVKIMLYLLTQVTLFML